MDLFGETGWLIGVYNGKFITAAREEKNSIWKANKEIHSSGFFRTPKPREKLVPYFFMLEPIPKGNAESMAGNAKLLGSYGLDALAYKYGNLKLPAYGHAENGCFFLDEAVVKKFEGEHGGDYCMGVDKIPRGRAFVLALMSEDVEPEDRKVRTGTFFKFYSEDKKAFFKPCKRGEKYLVGKGVLLGINPSANAGYMHAGEATDEMKCPVSKLMARFVYDGQGHYFIVYREVSTDMRADMPLALLKTFAEDRSIFENMFYNLGRSVREAKEKFGKMRTALYAWNVQLDGTIVDFADLVDCHIPGSLNHFLYAKEDLFKMLMSTALISIAGRSALSEMAKGWSKAAKLAKNKKIEGRVCERYQFFFNKFKEGAGEEISAWFREVGEADRL